MNETVADADQRQRLLVLLDRIAAIADRLRPLARGLTLVAGLCALWLSYLLQTATGAGLTPLAILLGVMLIPAFVFAWLWWVLLELTELPAEAERALGHLGRLGPGPKAKPDTAAPGVGGLFRLGGPLREAAGLAWHLEGVRGPIMGVLVLANPLYLLVLGTCLVSLVLMLAIGGVSALALLLF